MGKKDRHQSSFSPEEEAVLEANTAKADVAEANVIEGTAEQAPITRKMERFVGLHNRKDYDVTVVFKKDSIIISPGAVTGKHYKVEDILTVNGLSLQKAKADGLVYVVR